MEHDVDVNKGDVDGLTPLILICQKKKRGRNKIDIIKGLLEHGADINKGDMYDDTPLIKACKYDEIDTVKYLIEQGADINKENKSR